MPEILWLILGLAVGVIAGVIAIRAINNSRQQSAQREADALIQEARKQADTLKKEAEVEAKDEALKLRQSIEAEKTERLKEPAPPKASAFNFPRDLADQAIRSTPASTTASSMVALDRARGS